MGIYGHILCAVDFSRHSEVACVRAITLVKKFNGRLTLLHVIENFPEVRSNEIIAPEDIDPTTYRQSQAQKQLSDMGKQLQYEQATQQVVFTPYSAWHEIVHFSDDNQVDLIVLGSHGSFGITTLLGSTAHGVVNHAPCDVLTVRAIA